ncbi:MAG: hypothetical protein KJI71_04635 [Patescibacteria group bacterium]|nr:hypothetical protein [Patescibacteria group bacterium]
MSSAELARKSLIEHALDEIRNIPKYGNFKRGTYYAIAKLGLQRKAKVEDLFETADWNNIKRRDAIFERIEHFLVKYIK